MPANNCSVPGCHNHYKTKEKKSLFTIYRPDLSKNPEEKAHRERLTRFILSVRDASNPNDNIADMLCREMAAVCDDHFPEADILCSGKRRTLRLGAVPCYDPPKSSTTDISPSRKPPHKKKCSKSPQLIKAANVTRKESGEVVPVNEIPSAAVSASDRCKNSVPKRSRKRLTPLLEEHDIKIVASNGISGSMGCSSAKDCTRGTERNTRFHYSLALLHHDYIKTTTNSLKNYILSKHEASVRIAEGTAKPPLIKARKVTRRKQISTKTENNLELRRSKRKKKAYVSLGKKTKSNDVESTQNKESSEFRHDVRSEGDTAKLHKSDKVRLVSCNCPASRSRLKKLKRRKRLSLYGGTTKLERNPHRQYRIKRERQLLSEATSKSTCGDDSSIKKEYSLDRTCMGSIVGDLKGELQSYQGHMLDSMYAMQKSGSLCDFKIIVGSPRTQRQFSLLVHRLVFSCVSLKVKSQGGNVLDASQHLYKLDAPRIVEFVYTGKIGEIESLSQEEVGRLIKAASFLGIPKCISYLNTYQKDEDGWDRELDGLTCLELSKRNGVILCEQDALNPLRDEDGASGFCVDSTQNGVYDYDELPTGTLPPSTNNGDSLNEEVFEVADIRIESIVSQASDTTDTSSDETSSLGGIAAEVPGD